MNERSVPFNLEADSLNAAVLGPDVKPEDPEFALFVRELANEMTVKSGQKCTAIRRAMVLSTCYHLYNKRLLLDYKKQLLAIHRLKECVWALWQPMSKLDVLKQK